MEVKGRNGRIIEIPRESISPLWYLIGIVAGGILIVFVVAILKMVGAL